MSDEQWKEDGCCSQCRREKYCKTECTKHKRRVNNLIRGYVREKLDERSGGLFSQILDSSSFKDYI